MRLSADPSDSGYMRYRGLVLLNEGCPRVLLDGIEQSLVITLDTDDGWVLRTVVDEDGNIKISGDEVLYERISGRVEVVWD